MLANSLKPVSCLLRPSAMIVALLVIWLAHFGYRNYFAEARDPAN